MKEHYLKPGELFFGASPVPLRTLLGSCVALTLWHPAKRLVGMCHFVLPARPPASPPDSRYGDDAIAMLATAARRHGTRESEYLVGIYGGGNMFPEFNPISGRPVGEQNVTAARRLVQRHGLKVVSEAVGGYAYRQIFLDPEQGVVTVHTTEVRK